VPKIPNIPGPYRFFFYSLDCNEPMHVHVEWDAAICKFWLRPLTLASNAGFASHELGRIRSVIEAHLEVMIRAWNEHCGPT
jgi:hypothetical protein